MIAYLSIASYIHWKERNEVISEIKARHPEISAVSFWVKGSQYSDTKLKKADIVFSYISHSQIDDELVAYVGKGQYSEFETNEYQTNKKPFVVITNDYSEFEVIGHELYILNDWKKKYAKLKLKPIRLGKLFNKRLLLL